MRLFNAGPNGASVTLLPNLKLLALSRMARSCVSLSQFILPHRICVDVSRVSTSLCLLLLSFVMFVVGVVDVWFVYMFCCLFFVMCFVFC